MDGFAVRALSILASELKDNGNTRIEGFVRDFLIATRANDVPRIYRLIDGLKLRGISDDEIVSQFIPAAARRLGEEWTADRMNFATVSIGSSRLQGMLRHLGPLWCEEEMTGAPGAPECLILVPEGEQHTLGSSILTGQLRQNGVTTRLELDCELADIARLLAPRRYTAVLISSTLRVGLEFLREFVTKIRACQPNVTVVIGGNVLDQDADVAEVTGADLATSNLDDVMNVVRSVENPARAASTARPRRPLYDNQTTQGPAE